MADASYAIIAMIGGQLPWLVYLLRCADGTLYTGATNDLVRRLRAHGRGAVKYTRGRLPVTVAHTECALDKSDAYKKEAAWKRLSRGQKLARIAGSGHTTFSSGPLS
jgi:putative endonuclease